MENNFFKNKKIFLTGHTGFKGVWMLSILQKMQANVLGYALNPNDYINFYSLSNVNSEIVSINGDIRDRENLLNVFQDFQPEIVIHMAAQPLVRESYINPAYTYETNVLGTVNVLDCIRLTDSVRSLVNVTTDKVYKNNEWHWGYRETDELNGYDPYSNSKSCSELVTSSYWNSFLREKRVAVSTVRAGNVIGGGDFAKDRIIPDCIRAIATGEDIQVRNPYSIRPYEHVLEPVYAYLMIAQRQFENIDYSGNYNVGPDESDCLTTGALVELFCRKWKQRTGKDIHWGVDQNSGPHEASYLRLDCSKLKKTFGWSPSWNIDKAVEKTIEWSDVYLSGGNVVECMDNQIREFLASKQKMEILR